MSNTYKPCIDECHLSIVNGPKWGDGKDIIFKIIVLILLKK